MTPLAPETFTDICRVVCPHCRKGVALTHRGNGEWCHAVATPGKVMVAICWADGLRRSGWTPGNTPADQPHVESPTAHVEGEGTTVTVKWHHRDEYAAISWFDTLVAGLRTAGSDLVVGPGYLVEIVGGKAP